MHLSIKRRSSSTSATPRAPALLQCFLALRVGIMVKNFLVLLVATSYLWRPYLKRVQVRPPRRALALRF